jgi:5-methylcytosine-specific restriction enzyme subunit McrC
MITSIPIKNLYYLLLYAWDRVLEGSAIEASARDSTELLDLYARMYISGIQHILRRGIEQGYCAVSADMAGIRGRILVGQTVRRMLPQHGQAHCEFDELTVDTLANQILRAAGRRLLLAPTLSAKNRAELVAIDRSLSGIALVHLNSGVFRRVQLHSNNGFYGLLLTLCRLIAETPILDEERGNVRLRKAFDDNLASVYERFVRNFFKLEFPQYRVGSEDIRWNAKSESDPALRLLPKMITDTSIRMPERTLVIETKFYEETLTSRIGAPKYRSGHLYQLFSYLSSLSRSHPQTRFEGMLLYPVVGEQFRHEYEVEGQSIRVCTIDLGRDWREIREQLIELVAAPVLHRRSEPT